MSLTGPEDHTFPRKKIKILCLEYRQFLRVKEQEKIAILDILQNGNIGLAPGHVRHKFHNLQHNHAFIFFKNIRDNTFSLNTCSHIGSVLGPEPMIQGT